MLRTSTATFVAIAGLAVLSMIATDTQAGERGAQIEYHLSHERPRERGEPVIRFTTDRTLSDVEITLDRGGHQQVENFDALRPGQPESITIDQPIGTYSYEVTIKGTTSSGSRLAMGLEVEVIVLRGLEVELLRDEIDFDTGTIPIRSNNPVDRVVLEVFDRDDERRVVDTLRFDGARGRLELNFDPIGSVGKMKFVLHSEDGQTAEHLLRPLWIDMPTQIIHFETGSAELSDRARPSLEMTRQSIAEALDGIDDERGTNMRLYIAGYTDTVGSARDNLRLSERRARAIGSWFRSRGVEIPIYYQGFGQEVLAVDTPDGTAEEKNRRAVFILGNAPPRQSEDIPRSDWKRLR